MMKTAFGEPELDFVVFRGAQAMMQDGVSEAERGDNFIRRDGRAVRHVLHEHAHHVLSVGREGWISRTRDHGTQERRLGGASILHRVIGSLEVVERCADLEDVIQ